MAKCWESLCAPVSHSYIYKHLLSTYLLCAQSVARFGALHGWLKHKSCPEVAQSLGQVALMTSICNSEISGTGEGGWSGEGSRRKGCLRSFERGVTLLQADEGEGNTRWGNRQCQGLEIERWGSLQHFRPFSGAETHWKVCRRRKVWKNGCIGMRNIY